MSKNWILVQEIILKVLKGRLYWKEKPDFTRQNYSLILIQSLGLKPKKADLTQLSQI